MLKTVICKNMEFKTIKECAKYYDVNRGTMSGWLNGKTNMPEQFRSIGLRFKGKKQPPIKTNWQRTPIICDGIEYRNIIQCSKQYKINYYTMILWIRGKVPMPKEFKRMGLKFKTGK